MASTSSSESSTSSAEEDIIRFIYTGAIGEFIPDEATHITVAEDCTFVRIRAFFHHPNIVELVCHDGVKKIEQLAFYDCPSLRRVIIRGVKIVEREAFCNCYSLEEVECGKLEIIKESAFRACEMEGIKLLSARIVEEWAFGECDALKSVKFGSKLERIDRMAFCDCTSLQRITIPLKAGLITDDDINAFSGCISLKYVDLVEAADLHETIAALHLEEWRNDMNEEIDSINQDLLSVDASYHEFEDDLGQKTWAIRRWVRSVLRKIIHYKAAHQRLLEEKVVPTLQLALPQHIAMNNVLPFLELPPNTHLTEKFMDLK